MQRQSPSNSTVTETLAVRRNKGSMRGYWEFPGGKFEAGESMRGCLVRELQEELSVDVKIDTELGVHEFNNGEVIIKLHAFLVTRWQGEIKLHDHDKLYWSTPATIDQLRWSPADIPFVKQIKSSSNFLTN